jgi:H+/Cl- antiporter ClcA
MKTELLPRQTQRMFALSVLVGFLSGFSSFVFLKMLSWVTSIREQNSWLFYLLPFAGILIPGIYHLWGQEVSRANLLIVRQLRRFSQPRISDHSVAGNQPIFIPARLAPLIFITTLLTHLVGGSAGREGTAVQMSASFADQVAQFFKLTDEQRSRLLRAGISAGFGSVFGVPFAGIFFGHEIFFQSPFQKNESSSGRRFRLSHSLCFECVVASLVAHQFAISLGATHSVFQVPQIPQLSLHSVALIVVAGIFFGLIASIYLLGSKWFERWFVDIFRNSLLRGFVGGTILLAIYQFIPLSYRYAGLGTRFIEESMTRSMIFFDGGAKLLLTILTLGSGFKGGEVTPLLFVGSAVGNSLAQLTDLPISYLAALGFVGVFAGAAKVPLTCAIMAGEIFGITLLPHAVLVCYLSSWFSTTRGMYK